MPWARRPVAAAAIPIVVVAGLFVAGCDRGAAGTQAGSGAAAAPAAAAQLQITYPQEGTLFPPEIVAPTFTWEDKTNRADRWDVVVRDDSGAEVLRETVDAQRWRPSEERWRQIKQRSAERDAEVIVSGVAQVKPATVLSSGRVRIRTSKDEVGDALFYREVPL